MSLAQGSLGSRRTESSRLRPQPPAKVKGRFHVALSLWPCGKYLKGSTVTRHSLPAAVVFQAEPILGGCAPEADVAQEPCGLSLRCWNLNFNSDYTREDSGVRGLGGVSPPLLYILVTLYCIDYSTTCQGLRCAGRYGRS